jgi:hypothetical protein
MPIQRSSNGEGVIVINDFTGGLNTLIHPLFIQDNQTPTASNVWATGGVLTKRRAKIFYPLVTDDINDVGALFNTSMTGDDNQSFGVTTSSGNGGVINIQSVVTSGSEYLLTWMKTNTKILPASGIPSSSTDLGTRQFVALAKVRQKDWTSVSAMGLMISPNSTQAAAELDIITTGAGTMTTIRTTGGAEGRIGNSLWEWGAALILSATGSGSTGLRVAVPYVMWALQGGTVYRYYINKSLGITTSVTGTFDHVINMCPVSTADTVSDPGATAQQNVWAWDAVEMNETFYAPLSTDVGNGSGAFSFPVNTATGNFTGTVVTAWPATYGSPVNHKNYIFVCNSRSRTRVQWSALTDGTDWPTNNFIDIEKNSGTPIVKLVPFNGALMIFKKDGIWALLGDVFDPSNPSYRLEKLSVPRDFLIEYPDAITIESPSNPSKNTNIKVLTKTGLYSYFGGSTLVKLPEDRLPEPTVKDSKPIGSFLSHNQVPFGGAEVSGDWAASIFYDDNYILNIPVSGNGRCRRMMVKDQRGAWWPWHSVAATAEINSTKGTIFNNELFFTNNIRYDNVTDGTTINTAMGIVKEFVDQNNDEINLATAGVAASTFAITADWKSKVFDIGYGHFYTFTVYHTKQSSGNLEVTWWLDGANSASASFDMSVGQAAAGGLVKNTVHIDQPGHSIQFRVGNSGKGENFELYRIECRFRSVPDEEVV